MIPKPEKDINHQSDPIPNWLPKLLIPQDYETTDLITTVPLSLDKQEQTDTLSLNPT